MTYAQARRAGLRFLQQQQLPDGSFSGAAGKSIANFKVSRQQPTIFPTALILECLQSIDGSQTCRQAAAKFLLSQVNAQGSWNYWRRDSSARHREPYPDDLDDTACVLSALAHHDPSLIDGQRLGQLAQLLIAVEVAPSGPYNTWLIDLQPAPQWRDVDLAVNANVGFLLATKRVQLPGLENFIAEAIAAERVESAYYVGQLPVLYFLSRWYRGSGVEQLRAKVSSFLADNFPATALERALLLSAACRLGIAREKLTDLVTTVLADCQSDHWAAAPLYLDPNYGGHQYYGGSAELSTAFALEALALHEQLADKAATPSQQTKVPSIVSAARRSVRSVPDASLRYRYNRIMQQIASDNHGQQVAGIATIVAADGGWKLSSKQLQNLNLASLNGWIAYTIYDDFLDDDGQPKLLSVANLALRRSLQYFSLALPGNRLFEELVTTAFDQVDAANAWELEHARAIVQDNSVTLKRLPEYADYQQLADRSWGHSLASCGVLIAAGHTDLVEVEKLQLFFKHYLIARQLNDDAHDWEADLRRGQLSAVVTLLLKSGSTMPTTVRFDEHMDKLRLQFWDHTIKQVAQLIAKHVAAARNVLASCPFFTNSAAFMTWLNELEQAAGAALEGRAETRKFIESYAKD